MSRTSQYTYFDETYFQDGSKKGTAYTNYRESARSSPTFREIAQAMMDVFRPQRVLEIGCATGAIVKHLNLLGCEAHGIDVSEWAVRNAEHPNVRVASADKLPYPDGYFDLVLSCHSLEHLPDSIFERSLAEMTRVGSAFQFHMLPIVGLPPYDGNPAVIHEQLRKDPTHVQLHDFHWWITRFGAFGHRVIETSVLFEFDTAQMELTGCQFALKKSSSMDESPVLQRSAVRNRNLFRRLRLNNNGGMKAGIECMGSLAYNDRIWKDVEAKLERPTDFSGTVFNLALFIQGAPCKLRLAAVEDKTGDYSDVAEFHLQAHPGLQLFRFSVDQMKTLRGAPDFSRITRVSLGGQNAGCDITFFLCDQNGLPVLR